MANLAVYTYDFGRIPFGNDESLRIVMTVKNVGGTQAELSIKFPDETGEIEQGVDNSSRSYTKNIKSSIHKQLFDIKPRKMKIQPGAMSDIEIFYNPREVGFHELTVVLMMTNGKPFQVTLKGETIDKHAGIISPFIGDVCLYPTPINLQYPVTNQIYFRNTGNSTVRWTIDRSQVQVFGDGIKLLDDIGILEEQGETGKEDTDFITLLYKPHLKTVMNIMIPMETEDENGFKSSIMLRARCITYDPNHETLSTLQQSSDPQVM
jgi:archaellum component FlaG (FlaF/FlaG flagellin family)